MSNEGKDLGVRSVDRAVGILDLLARGGCRTGLAHTHEELELGLDAMAAPVYGPEGDVVAAVDVSGPSQRLAGRPELDRLTREAAADLSRRLGYRGRRPET